VRAPGLPFVHLNLRINPFGEATPDDRAGLAVVDLPMLVDGDVLQIVADCGRGKTTHLLALRAAHPESAYERLDLGQTRCRQAVPATGLFLVDEAQELESSALRRLLRRRGPLVLGTHFDLSRVAGRSLPLMRLADLGRGRLRQIVDRRLEWARRAEGPVPYVSDAVLDRLLARFGDDVRAIESALYDAIQSMKEPGHVEV
jgi:hypothetical protein